MIYRDLSDYGVRFVAADDPAFSAIADDIRTRFLAHDFTHAFRPLLDRGLDAAVVLLNETDKAIVVLAYVWTFIDSNGQTRRHTHTNLGSSVQWDVLAGLTGVWRDPFSFILPGSKRLITQHAVFGDNTDVLAASEWQARRGGGVCMGGGGGRRENVDPAELHLDAVLFEDGLFVGPDQTGLFDAITSELQRQREVSSQIVQMLRAGASIGEVFEVLRPLAKFGPGASSRHLPPSPFGRTGIQKLVQGPDDELLSYFEKYLATPLNLRRPA